jgi:hypothetical protein
VISETGKVVARLENKEKAVSKGHIVIRPKIPISNNINAIDEET